MEVNILNINKKIEEFTEIINNLSKVDNFSNEVTNFNPAIIYEKTVLKRWGRVYFLDVEISRTENCVSGDILFTVPLKYMTDVSVNCTVTGGENSRNQDVIISEEDGNVIIRGDISNSSWLKICATWIK